ncbi:sensor histidine kinase [Ornithobacterium rhinotracheale]|uniref:sensor histidine kinase n=1 Tax=Ornithobacterium rhinotracheale TaxID=28251 RepID=UPI003FA4566C
MKYVATYMVGVILAVFSYSAAQQGNRLSAGLLGVGSLLCLYLIYHFQHNKNSSLLRLITAVRYKDFSFRPKKTKNHVYNELRAVFEQVKSQEENIVSYKMLYEHILNQSQFGLMILSRETEQDKWDIFFANYYFLEIFKLPNYQKWSYCQTKMPKFYEIIEKTKFQNSQAFYTAKTKDFQLKTYSIRTSRVKGVAQQFFVINIESVQDLVEKKEKMAWYNLLKVISHELMNTLTPINSLIQSMQYATQQDEIQGEDLCELREGMNIVAERSGRLMQFVDDYRKITQIPKAYAEKIEIKQLLQEMCVLLQNDLQEKQIECDILGEPTMIWADKSLTERVLVNLLSNAIFALENLPKEDRKIELKIEKQHDSVLVKVRDYGHGIDEEIAEKVFFPFFTTREKGSGIGLTLCKNIMEAQSGRIYFKNLAQGCEFVLVFKA